MRKIKVLIKLLMGIPQRIKILGFYKGVPILHDPENPAPDGMVYFIKDFSMGEKQENWKYRGLAGKTYKATGVKIHKNRLVREK